MQAESWTCPRPEHAGSRIIRNGSYGPYGRQRFKCLPARGEPHTFSVLVAPADPDAAARLKSFRHSVADIARALVSIGRGASYRQAALQVSRDPGSRGINGQLVANWVTTFGPVVTDADRTWPEVISVGAFPLRRGARRDDLLVQLASAAMPAGVVHIQVSERDCVDAWQEFYGRLAGRPAAIIVEPSRPAASAALRRWPDQPPVLLPPRPRADDPDVVAHGGPDVNIAAANAQFRRYRDILFRRLANRQSHFTKLDQLNHLAGLMRLDVNGTADQAVYVDRILGR
jgi:hypothetical protein